jgi:dTDP-glucose 4,6-dehydratase
VSKKILLTGCAGFIGSNFIKTIASKNQDYDFVILDALTYAGHLPTIQTDIDENDHLSFVKMDIRNKEDIDSLFSKEKFDGVIHFAAESHVDNSITNPNIFVETNVLGTLNLLNTSLKRHKDLGDQFKFVHVSTDEVYGTLTETDPAFTEQNQIEPNSPYSASKASSDLLVRSYFETFKLNTCITRCSNNYGPFQFPEKLIPLMISNALSDKALPVYGDGQNIRDWIYVDDHNNGIWATYLKGNAGEVYNFGGDAEKRNLDVVKTLLSIVKKPESLITFVKDRKGHDWRYAMNFEKATKELNWKPEVTFEEGLQRTVNWYVENQKWCQEVSST